MIHSQYPNRFRPVFAAPFVALLFLLVLPVLTARAEDSRIFELRTYHANQGKLEALEKRFRDHTVALFEKHGMTNVAYWVPTDNSESVLVYLMAYPNREARDAMWKAFKDDPDWKAAYAASTADGKLVGKVDQLFLEMTDYSPELKIEPKDPERLFELRIYTTNPGKLTDLDARFRDHTVDLFEKHGMTNVAYFHPVEGEETAGHTLVYLLAHPDLETRDASFKAFAGDPDWQAARKASEENGKILIKGGVKNTFLKPLDFSPMK